MMNDKERLWGVHEWCIDIQNAISQAELEIHRWLSNPGPGLHINNYRSAASSLLLAQQVAWTKISSVADLLDYLETSLARILQKIGAPAFDQLCCLSSFRHIYARHNALYRAALRERRKITGDTDGSGGAPPLTPAPSARDLKRNPEFWTALATVQATWRPVDIAPPPVSIIIDQHDTLPAPNLVAAVIARDDDEDEDEYQLPAF